MAWGCRLRCGLLAATGAIGLLASGAAAAAPALPTGGSVAAGSAAISSSGASMTISQSTPKAIIDWQGFSIGQGGGVQFDNGSGATLNRVTGTSGSAIDGLLSGTGSVYLINPNGVIVGKTGEVKVGGTFVASALDVANASFLSGGALTFSGPSTAAVVNEGKVGSLGGDIVLIASSVSNSGSLSAPNGTAGLLAGRSVLLRDQALDDGKFSVLVGGSSTSATNSGLIEAANAELRANGGNVYALAGNTAGIIRATGVKQGDGHVWLMSGDEGATNVAGEITAKGANGAGGTIETSGGTLEIGAAKIDASGGSWLVDPTNLVITSAAADTISDALATSDVTEQTTASGYTDDSGLANTSSGAGNITLVSNAVISWSSAHTLTLDAYHDLVLKGLISLDSGTLNLQAGAAITVSGEVDVTGAGTVNLSAAVDTSTIPGKSLLQLSFPTSGLIDFGPSDNGGALNINGQAYTLVYDYSDLPALSGVPGNYAIATDLLAPRGSTGSVIAELDGTLEGLGHVLEAPHLYSSETNVGVVGVNLGTIRDLGSLDGLSQSPSYSSFNVGTLVGENDGLVANSFSTSSILTFSAKSPCNCAVGGLVGKNGVNGAISGSYSAGIVSVSSNTVAGGLVGEDDGVIVGSYASGPLRAGVNGTAGGLVGLAKHDTIQDSYALGGATTGVNGNAGGLIGEAVSDVGSPVILTRVFAAGYVHGGAGSSMGGLVGLAAGGGGAAVTNGYYDSDTTGQGSDAAGATPQTTAQLQAGLPTGFSAPAWSQIASVSYPYLASFYPGETPQVISGRALLSSSAVSPPLKGTQIEVIEDGQVLGDTYSGANGYYYIVTPPFLGTPPGGDTVIASMFGSFGASSSAIEQVAAGASVTGLNLVNNIATITTPDTTLSQTADDLALGIGCGCAPTVFFASGGEILLPPYYGLTLNVTGPSFDFDSNLDVSLATLNLVASGAVTQSNGYIGAARLQGSSHGGLALTGDNAIADLYGWKDTTGSISINNLDQDLLIDRPVTARAGISLTTTDSGDIHLYGTLTTTSGDITLTSAGEVVETASYAAIHDVPGVLTVSANDNIDLQGVNYAASVNLSSNGGSVTYAEVGGLAVASATTTGDITLVARAPSTGTASLKIAGPILGDTVTLTSAGSISEPVGGSITANLLTGSALGAVTLTRSNQIVELGDFNSGGDFKLTNQQALTQSGVLNAGGVNVSLTTSTGDIAVNGEIDASSLTLRAITGALTEADPDGAIKVGVLNATAKTGITLGSSGNQITTVGTDTTKSGPNTIQQ